MASAWLVLALSQLIIFVLNPLSVPSTSGLKRPRTKKPATRVISDSEDDSDDDVNDDDDSSDDEFYSSSSKKKRQRTDQVGIDI